MCKEENQSIVLEIIIYTVNGVLEIEKIHPDMPIRRTYPAQKQPQYGLVAGGPHPGNVPLRR
jgi:hypothetical protein